MLKVLQVVPTLDRSGAEKQMVMLATGLPRDRFQVEVAALTRSGPFAADLAAAGVPLAVIGKRLRWGPLALAKLARLVRAGGYDVVHCWLFAANAYGRVAARLAGAPVVVVSEMAVDVWKGRLPRWVDRRLAPWCDRLVGNSHAVVDFYRGLSVSDDRLAMIYSGIGDDGATGENAPDDVDRAATRDELGIGNDAPLVLFAGRLAEQKRVGDLLMALDLLQHIEPGLRSLIVGDGPLRSRLEATARGYALDGRVRFLGHRDDVPRLMSAADIVALPSAYEGLPNVVLEAMMRARPVVATAAPGTTEVVVDGETGVLVPIGEPIALARALRDLARDPERARRLGAAGRDRAIGRFSLQNMIDQYAELYERIARAKKAGGGPAV